METTKLQLGDIVKCSDKGIPMYVVGLLRDVAYLDFEGNEGDMWEVDEEDLRPIPITPEILEKNGFKKRIYDTSIVGKEGRITLNDYSNSVGRNWYCHIDNEDFEFIGGADVQYVHELQHLLKLCGIDKEITL